MKLIRWIGFLTCALMNVAGTVAATWNTPPPASVVSGSSVTVKVTMTYPSGSSQYMPGYVALWRQSPSGAWAKVWMSAGTPNTSVTSVDVAVKLDGVGTWKWSATSEPGPNTTSPSGSGQLNATTVAVAPNTPPFGGFDGATRNVYQGRNLDLNGWAADTQMGSPVSRVDILVDGSDVGDAILGQSRQDVANAYSNSDYADSGWRFSYGSSGLSAGDHTVTARAWDNQGAYTDLGTKTFTVCRNPSGSVQILDSGKNALPLDGNGRARISIQGQQFYVRVSGSDPDGNLAQLYARLNKPDGSAFAYPEAASVSGASASYDFGPYTADAVGVWDVWAHVVDATNTGYEWNGGGWYGIHSPDIEVYQPNRAPGVAQITVSASAIKQGEWVGLTSSTSDPDGNLIFHPLYQRGARGANTFAQDENGWSDIWANSSAGWSAWNNGNAANEIGRPTNGSSSSISARFTPSAPGYWQFAANGIDVSGIGGTRATSAAVFVAPLPAATISATAHSGADKTAAGGGTIITYVGDPIALSAVASATGWLSEQNIYAYNNATPSTLTMVAGGGLSAAATLTSNTLTGTWTPTASGTYTIYTEAFTGRSAKERVNGTSGYPGYLDGGANKRITVVVRANPTGSFQILNASKQAIALDVNGRAPLEAGQQFYVRVTGSSPNGTVGQLYVRMALPGDGTSYGNDNRAPTSGGVSTDFGPYSINRAGVCDVWAHVTDDHAAGWGSYTPWDGNKLGWATMLAPDILLKDTSAPSAPTSLSASNLAASTFTLNWTASSDNASVSDYEVFQDGVSIGMSGGANSKPISGLVPGIPYAFTVRAKDPSGNFSANSATLSVELTLPASNAYQGSSGSLPAPTSDITAGGKLVGSTVGSLSVGKTGEASYSIPLWVVPGTSGMEPKLSLNYSSQGGPGIAGYGWSLGGLSAISRGPLTKLVDGQIRATQLAAADAYYMDGQRLVVVSGQNGAADSEYRTQMESFTKVVAQGSSGYGPEWFKAWTKAGLIIEFGNPSTDADARVNSDQVSGAYLSWAVTKITDIAGNYMTFSYDWDATNREQLLSRIDYTGNTTAGLSTYASVEFTYEARSDSRVAYSTGSKSGQTKRLKEIVCRGPSGVAKRYTLAFISQPLTNFSLLDSLTEADANARSYEPLRFAYAQHNSGNMYWSSSAGFAPPKPVSSKKYAADVGTGFIDLNGDGWTDFVCQRLNGGGSPDTARNGVWLGSANGFVQQASNSPWVLPAPLAREEDGDQGARFVDLNGDGRVDFVWSQRDNSNKGAYLNTGSGWGKLTQWDPPDYFVYSQTKTGAAQFADINGDGLPDLVVARRGADNRNGVYFNTGSGFSALNTAWALPAYLWDIDLDDTGARLVDLNGDGLPDIIQGRWTENGAWDRRGAWLNTGSGWESASGYLPSYPLCRDEYPIWGAEFTDLNGDGLVDLVVNHFNGTTTYNNTYLNTGRGWSAVPSNSPYRSPWNLAINNSSGSGAGGRAGTALLDLNQDGLPDEIWKRSWDGAASPQHGVSFMTPSGFRTTDFESEPLQISFFFLAYDARPGVGGQFVDVNADGAPDFVWNHDGDNVPSGYPVSGAYLNKTPRPNLLTSVTNGFGVTAQVVYTHLTARAADGSFTVYDQGSAAPSPTSRLGVGPMTVVQAIKHDDGIGGTYDLTYRYGTLRSHPLYGSLGFRDVTVVDSRTNTRQYTQSSQTYPYIGMPEYTETKVAGTLIQQGAVTYATKEYTQANGTKTLLPLATSSVSKTFDPSGTKVSDTTTLGSVDWYDAYGNVTKLQVDSYDGSGAVLASVVTTNTYYDGASSLTTWRLGRLARSTVTHSRTGLPSITRTSSFTYAESNTGMLESEIVEPDAGAALKVTTTRTRDSFGNVTNVTTTTTDPIVGGTVTRTATTQYDTKGRFPLWTKNALNQQETYTYDQNLGLKLSLKGPNGLTTSWEYDSFGRVTKETRPDATYSVTIHAWDSSYKYLIHTETRAANGTVIAPPSRTYFDRFGRARLAQGLNGDGKLLYVATEYDNQGRAYKTSQPYFSGGTQYWATTEFDTYGRPSKVWTPVDDPSGSGSILQSLTTYTYEGLHNYTVVKSPVDASGNATGSYSKTRRKDSWVNMLGQTVTVVDNYHLGETSAEYAEVSYSHDAIGNVKTTTIYKQDNSFYTTTFEYDARGRKTKMIDPDMGTWTYEYDALGQLRRQTDAKNQQVTMTYDGLGRMGTRTRPETSPSSRSVVTVWTYDTASGAGVGKLASVATYSGSASTVNADYYREIYTYDSLGRPGSIKRIIFDENSGTDLDPDSPANTRAYTFGYSYDAYGRLDRTTYPFGYQTQNTYSALGQLKEIRRTDGTGVGSDGQHSASSPYYNRVLWQAAKVGDRTTDEYGRALAAKLGNGIELVWTRPTGGGGVTRITATLGGATIRRFDYAYDGFQNVRYRADRLRDLSGTEQLQEETFRYDALQRLLGWQISGQSEKTAAYDALGNITNKSDVGAYTYGGAAPHAVTAAAGRSFAYDSNGNCTSDGQRTIQWTASNQVCRIDKGSYYAEFTLDAADQRVRQKSNSGTTIYVGGLFERFVATGNTAVEHRFYVITPTGRAVLHTEDGSAANGKDQYFVGDALGSISSVYDHRAQHVETRRYDPWGVQTKVIAASGVTPTTRGFTDHEMLEGVGLIHMNGRVYDPVLGRFLSADPFVDDATTAGAYNRYAYCGNDPLGHTDPSGFFSLKSALIIVAVVVLSVVTAGAAAAAATAAMTVTSATATAAATFSIGGIAISASTAGLIAAVAGGAAAGFVGGFAGSLLNGGGLGDAFKAGIIGGIVGGISAGIANKIGDWATIGDWNLPERALAHGVAQGVVTEASGGEFRHGFYAGAVTTLASPGIDRIGKGQSWGKAARVAAAATVGGTASALGGGKFVNGAISGAFTRMYNHESVHEHERGAIKFEKADESVPDEYIVEAAAQVDLIQNCRVNGRLSESAQQLEDCLAAGHDITIVVTDKLKIPWLKIDASGVCAPLYDSKPEVGSRIGYNPRNAPGNWVGANYYKPTTGISVLAHEISHAYDNCFNGGGRYEAEAQRLGNRMLQIMGRGREYWHQDYNNRTVRGYDRYCTPIESLSFTTR